MSNELAFMVNNKVNILEIYIIMYSVSVSGISVLFTIVPRIYGKMF